MMEMIDTYYQKNNFLKYRFIDERDVTVELEQKLRKLLNDRCDIMIFSFWYNRNDLYELFLKILDGYILETGYVKNCVLYSNSHKRLAIKCRYSREVIKNIKLAFDVARYFPFFHDAIDCSYYEEELCLLTQVGEYQGLHLLKRLEIQ